MRFVYRHHWVKPFWLPILFTAVVLITACPSIARAGRSCSDIFSVRSIQNHRDLNVEGRALIRIYGPLRLAETTSPVVLDRKQQTDLAISALTVVRDAQLALTKAKVQVGDTKLGEQVGRARIHIEEAATLFHGLQSKSARLEPLESVVEKIDWMIKLTTDVADLLGLSRQFGERDYLFNHQVVKFKDLDVGASFYDRSYDEIRIPTSRLLSIYDFNELVGTGLYPIGLSFGTVHADGITWNGEAFYRHDKVHAGKEMPRAMSPTYLLMWRSLLEWANSGEPRGKALRHAILFYLSHEKAYLKSAFDNKLIFPAYVYGNKFVTSTATELARRLRAENYWDDLQLPEVANMQLELRRQIQNLFVQWNLEANKAESDYDKNLQAHVQKVFGPHP